MDGPVELTVFPNQAVIILTLPEGPAPPEDSVCLSRSEQLPAPNHTRQLLSWEQTEDHMHMIRHHAPRYQPISLTVPIVQGVRDQIANLGIAEETCAVSAIEASLDSLGAKLRD